MLILCVLKGIFVIVFSMFGDCNNDCWQYYENDAIEALLFATMIKI